MSSLGTFEPLKIVMQRAGIPHEVVMRPAIHVEEIRTTPGDEIAGHGNPKTTVHQPDAGPKRYAHRSLHVCPHTWIPDRIITRDEPARQETSVVLQDQQRDWDFIERHRDLVFDNRQIRMDDAPWDKVHALAEDIWTFRRVIQKPGGNDFSRSCPWSHPVDSLIYGSWCLGAAYAIVALCATLGYRAREIAIRGHSQAEVHVNGRWRLIESISRFPENGGENMVADGFAQIRLDPFSDRYTFADEQRETYWETDRLSFSAPDNGLWLQQCRNTFFTPRTAAALYPDWTEPRFKSHHADRYDLVWGDPGHTGAQEALILRPGRAIQRRFWLGSLAETAGLKATFNGVTAPQGASWNVPRDGGEWFIAVNDAIHPVRDAGGWDFRESTSRDTWRHGFDIALNELRENDWNTLAIGCPQKGASGGEFLWLGGGGEWSLPAEPCICRELGG